MNNLKLEQTISNQLERGGKLLHRRAVEGVQKPIESNLQFSNPFGALHYRAGKLIGVYEGFNGVTIEGKNHALDVVFGNSSPVTQVDPWYIGLIDQSPTPTLVEGDTLASHSGWSEASGYTGNRQAWVDANASSKVKGTTTVASFPITGTATIHGIMIASVATGTSGILWATGSFDASIDVVSSDTLKVTYGIRT